MSRLLTPSWTYRVRRWSCAFAFSVLLPCVSPAQQAPGSMSHGGSDVWQVPLSRDLMPHFEPVNGRSEEHTSELQSQFHLVCRLLLEKKKKKKRLVRPPLDHTTLVLALRRGGSVSVRVAAPQ